MLFSRGREKRGPVLALLGMGVYAHVCMMAMCFVRLRLFVFASSDDHGVISIRESGVLGLYILCPRWIQ